MPRQFHLLIPQTNRPNPPDQRPPSKLLRRSSPAFPIRHPSGASGRNRSPLLRSWLSSQAPLRHRPNHRNPTLPPRNLLLATHPAGCRPPRTLARSRPQNLPVRPALRLQSLGRFPHRCLGRSSLTRTLFSQEKKTLSHFRTRKVVPRTLWSPPWPCPTPPFSLVSHPSETRSLEKAPVTPLPYTEVTC